MKTHKSIWVSRIVIVILLVLDIILLQVNRNNQINYNLSINKQNDRIHSDSIFYQNIQSRMFDAYQYDGYEIDMIEIFENFSISNNCLVVRFPELACNTCTDSILCFMSQILSKQDLGNVIILIDDLHEQYMYQMERLNHFVYPNIIETRNNNSVLPIDESGLPYFFMINEIGKCSMIFIPEKDKPEETRAYISLIKNKMFNN